MAHGRSDTGDDDSKLEMCMIPVGMGTPQICQNGNGKSTRDNGNGYFFTCTKIPVGRLDANAIQ